VSNVGQVEQQSYLKGNIDKLRSDITIMNDERDLILKILSWNVL